MCEGLLKMLTYKRKLILTEVQENRISSWIGACRYVYNMGLEIRKEAWKNKQISISAYDLMKQLPEIKHIDWIKDVPSQSLQNSIERLEKSYKTFFRTFGSGGGFPKFANKRRYKSIVLKNQNDAININENKINLPKIGEIKFFKDKSPIIGKIKTATIIKEPTGYFVCIVCEGKRKAISNRDESQILGIDMGVTYFYVDSNGNFIENPKHFKRHEEKLANAQRVLSGKIKFSNRWKKQAKIVAKHHHKIADVRKDFLHKESTKLAKHYHTIFVEDLNIANMTKRAKPKQDEQGNFIPNGQARKSGLNKSILDCGWGMFRDMLENKTNVVRVNPKFTSQTCNKCNKKDATSRISQSEFCCKFCGHKTNADFNAAKNILSKGIALIETQGLKLCA